MSPAGGAGAGEECVLCGGPADDLVDWAGEPLVLPLCLECVGRDGAVEAAAEGCGVRLRGSPPG